MAFPNISTAEGVTTDDLEKFLRTIDIVSAARRFGTFEFVLLWLNATYNLPLVEINDENYVNLDELEAWAASQDWNSIWGIAEKKYKICVQRTDGVANEDPFELNQYGTSCPAMFLTGTWWRQ
jgi:hypothetical protein